MKTINQSSNDKLYVARALEASIHIGLVALIILWCFKIGRPFIEIIVWGIIIAVAIHPIYYRLTSTLGGRDRLAATLITLLAVILLLVPTIMLSESLIETAREYSAQLKDGTLSVPPPRRALDPGRSSASLYTNSGVLSQTISELCSARWRRSLNTMVSRYCPPLLMLGSGF